MGDFDLNTIPQLNEIDSAEGEKSRIKSSSLPLLKKEVRAVESLVLDALIDGNDSAALVKELNVMYLVQTDTSGRT